jgi:hypothetical protein
MEVAELLVQHGARKLLLISRRGVTNGYKSMRIRCWSDAGIVVATSTQDITNEEGAATLLQKASMLGPIGGIFVLTVVSGQCKMIWKTTFVPEIPVHLIHCVLNEKV